MLCIGIQSELSDNYRGDMGIGPDTVLAENGYEVAGLNIDIVVA